jgi:hypothetical protein
MRRGGRTSTMRLALGAVCSPRRGSVFQGSAIVCAAAFQLRPKSQGTTASGMYRRIAAVRLSRYGPDRMRP